MPLHETVCVRFAVIAVNDLITAKQSQGLTRRNPPGFPFRCVFACVTFIGVLYLSHNKVFDSRKDGKISSITKIFFALPVAGLGFSTCTAVECKVK